MAREDKYHRAVTVFIRTVKKGVLSPDEERAARAELKRLGQMIGLSFDEVHAEQVRLQEKAKTQPKKKKAPPGPAPPPAPAPAPVLERSAVDPAPGGPNLARNQQYEVFDVPLADVHADPPRFQPRGKAFSEESAARVAADKHPELMEPIWVWRDPANSLIYVLAGHSRLEGYRRRDEATIPVQFFQGDEAAATAFAWTENDKGTSLSNAERARYIANYRRCCSLSKANTRKEAERLYGKNATTVLALSHLNASGKALSTIIAFESNATGEGKDAETMGVWIGKLRAANPALTDSHEEELTAYLLKHYKTRGRRLKSFDEFRKLIDSVIARKTTFGDFEAESPLNIEAVRPESRAATAIDTMLAELARQSKAARDARDAKHLELGERRLAGEVISADGFDRVMKPFHEAARHAESIELAARREAQGARATLRQTEATLFDNPAPRQVPASLTEALFVIGEVDLFISTAAMSVRNPASRRKPAAYAFAPPSMDALLLVPPQLVRKNMRRGGTKQSEAAFEAFHGFEPTGDDLRVRVPVGEAVDAGFAVAIIYRTEKGDPPAPLQLVHYFDVGRRRVSSLPDGCFVVEDVEITGDGIMN